MKFDLRRFCGSVVICWDFVSFAWDLRGGEVRAQKSFVGFEDA